MYASVGALSRSMEGVRMHCGGITRKNPSPRSNRLENHEFLATYPKDEPFGADVR